MVIHTVIVVFMIILKYWLIDWSFFVIGNNEFIIHPLLTFM